MVLLCSDVTMVTDIFDETIYSTRRPWGNVNFDKKEVSGYSSEEVRLEGKIDITVPLQIATP